MKVDKVVVSELKGHFDSRQLNAQGPNCHQGFFVMISDETSWNK